MTLSIQLKSVPVTPNRSSGPLRSNASGLASSACLHLSPQFLLFQFPPPSSSSNSFSVLVLKQSAIHIFSSYFFVWCLCVSYGAAAHCRALAACSSGFEPSDGLRGELVSPSPNTQPGGLDLCIYGARRQVDPAIPLDIG